MKLLVSVYKSPVKDEMYLYVLKKEQLTRVPEGLTTLFGQPRHVMDLLLTPERKLARAETTQVIQLLEEQGYYLQMPPPQDDYIEHLPDELLTKNDPV
ncbi:YcgL domain-containing protein [Endozoicomonas sp. Mp262]|uniref:YcgL domain-containing protein n=1 Tax=Endozoicomonas sp. Mp262 TaxID=2919499 RepID=UPI0021D866D6